MSYVDRTRRARRRRNRSLSPNSDIPFIYPLGPPIPGPPIPEQGSTSNQGNIATTNTTTSTPEEENTPWMYIEHQKRHQDAGRDHFCPIVSPYVATENRAKRRRVNRYKALSQQGHSYPAYIKKYHRRLHILYRSKYYTYLHQEQFSPNKQILHFCTNPHCPGSCSGVKQYIENKNLSFRMYILYSSHRSRAGAA
ncbi:uncharacterized protein LOC133924621 [Phragmites australis]|uniref:uncharacterized protein LOC133924621 n=1 Tax=Phragmites australis TaxID=29695 RepID=UPI002D78B16F|nr:uncharacterized protein LOC133924621 [Phragmites australis]